MGQFTYKTSRLLVEGSLQVGDLERNLPSFVEGEELSVVLNPQSDRIKLQVHSLTGELLEVVEEGRIPTGQNNGGGSDLITVFLDPVLDATELGYTEGDVQLQYQFLRDWYTLGENTEFYVDSISGDRTEIRCYNPELTSALLTTRTGELFTRLNQEEFLPEILLRFPNGVSHNILNTFSTVENGRTYVVFKLYTPLSVRIGSGDTFTVEEEIATPVAFQVEAFYQEDIISPILLKGPNFENTNTSDGFNSTPQFSYEDLLVDEISNTFYEVRSQVERKGLQISVDFSDYSNFVHFSSAVERLKIFKYKLETLEGLELQLEEAQLYLPANIQKYKTLISNLLKNMDDYERYLYFENTEHTWPKLNTEKPFQNRPSSSTIGLAWYNNQMETAESFDEQNPHRLTLTVPRYLREDPANLPYLVFVDMIGNHFDNIWLYSKSFSQRFNTDHRPDQGLSRDLVRQAVESLGVKMFGASSNINSLLSFFSGQTYVSGSEKISEYIVATSGSTSIDIQPVATKSYEQEIYKRIYHNLPLLLKTKGTERSIRTLINCYGIPSSILEITQYGGTSRNTSRYTGPMEPLNSSIDKIRISNQYSEEPGDTLSQYTSILTPSREMSDDQPAVEIGFNPSLLVWEELKEALGPEFNIDNYIGDPRLGLEKQYVGLKNYISEMIPKLEVEGILRLLKFFDNALFRIIQNFIPAKANLSTGVVISSSPLQRSKHSQPQISFEHNLLEGEEEVGRIEGSHGESILGTTAYTFLQETPLGDVSKTVSDESPKYNGELQGSQITVLQDGELNSENRFKNYTTSSRLYNSDWNPTVNNVMENRKSIFAKNKVYGVEETISRDITTYTYMSGDPSLQFNILQAKYIEAEPETLSFHEFELLIRFTEPEIIPFLESKIIRKHSFSAYYSSSVYGEELFPLEKYSKLYFNERSQQITFRWTDFYPVTGSEDFLFYTQVVNFANSLYYPGEVAQLIFTVEEQSTMEWNREEVQDQIYYDTGLDRSKHKGSKTTGIGINQSSWNGTGLGTLPPVERRNAYFGYVSNISDPYPVSNNTTYLRTRYLVGEDGQVVDLLNEKYGEEDLKRIFRRNSYAIPSLEVPKGEAQIQSLNSPAVVKEVGKEYSPILYSQTSSIGAGDVIRFKGSEEAGSEQKLQINWGGKAEGKQSIHGSGVYLPVVTSNVSLGDYRALGIGYAPFSSSGVNFSPPVSELKERYKIECEFELNTPVTPTPGEPLDSRDYAFMVLTAGGVGQQVEVTGIVITPEIKNTLKHPLDGQDIEIPRFVNTSINLWNDFAVGESRAIAVYLRTDVLFYYINNILTPNNKINSIEDLVSVKWRISYQTIEILSPPITMKPQIEVISSPGNVLKIFGEQRVSVRIKNLDNTIPSNYIRKETFTDLPSLAGSTKRFFWQYDPEDGSVLPTSSRKLIFIPVINRDLYGKEYFQAPTAYHPSSSLRFNQEVEPMDVKFPNTVLPWEIQEGDEIRFENNEIKTYKIVAVNPNYYRPLIGRRLQITVDREIPSSTDLDFFLIRRLIPSKGMVIIGRTFPYTNPTISTTDTPTTEGYLLPEFPVEGLQSKMENIYKSLVERNIIK